MARYLRRLSLIAYSFWIGWALQRECTIGQPLKCLLQNALQKCPVEKVQLEYTTVTCIQEIWGYEEGKTYQNSNGHPQGWPLLMTHIPAGRLPARLTGLTAWFTRLGLIHREGPPLNLLALEIGNRRSGGGAIGHLDKAKALRSNRIAVRNNTDLVHRAIRLEELADVMISGTEGKIADKDI